MSSTTLWSNSASATFSVLLTNTRTGELGGAVTSCVGDFDLQNIFAVVATPNGDRVGVFTQSWFSEDNHHRVQELLTAGVELEGVLTQVTDPTFDPDQADRQYHLLRTNGVGVTWTGTNAGAFAGGVTGTFDEWAFTAAGNILTSERVLSTLEVSLRASQGALEHRLLSALEAVEAAHEGDSRCTPLPGDSAFIGVVDTTGARRVWHTVTNTAPASPLQQLRTLVGEAPLNTDVLDAGLMQAAVTEDRAPAKATTCSSIGRGRAARWAWYCCVLAVACARLIASQRRVV